jgi:hypothetical protein
MDADGAAPRRPAPMAGTGADTARRNAGPPRSAEAVPAGKRRMFGKLGE